MRDALTHATGADSADRVEMQKRAAALDLETGGQWVVDYLAGLPKGERAIVDAVRTLREARALMDSFDSSLVYLDASEATRRRRYEEGRATDQMKAALPFDAAMAHPIEIEALRVRDVATVIIDTNSLDVDEVAEQIVEHLDE